LGLGKLKANFADNALEHLPDEVQAHLRNVPTNLIEDLGYGEEYRYAHDEVGAYAIGENYFPAGHDVRYYFPTNRGLEVKIAEKLD